MTWSSSLRLRLLIGGAAWIVLALVVAGIFISASFEASINAARRDDLEASFDRLVASIDPATGALASAEPLADPRYNTPLGGLYWQVDDADAGTSTRSRSLWDETLPLSSIPRHGADATLATIPGPGGTPLLVFARSVTVAAGQTSRHFDVGVAEARSVDDNPILSFNTSLLIALVILGATLLAAAVLQVNFGLAPLGRLRRSVAAVRNGAIPRLAPPRTEELEGVVQQVNELLDAQEATITFARERASDLAHGLKTPLAVLSATSARLRESGDRINADLLEMLTDQMNARIDYQLRMARLRFRTRAQGVKSSVNEVVLRSVTVLRKSVAGERLNWLVDLDENLEVDMDPHDLMELAGILLENATQWAHERVRLRCARDGDWIAVVIEDDGVGISDDAIARLGVRGTRLDETKSGEGIGLAIAYEVVRLNRGTISATRGDMGGLRLSVRLPAAPAGAP